MTAPGVVPLNIFYLEPDSDRWIRGDRYARRVVRRVIRGKRRPGGQTRVFLDLCAGLDRIGVDYRINDFRYAMKHPEELVCIVGKPFVLDMQRWRNPILFGAATFSHPIDDLALFDRLPVQHVLVPGPWMEAMCKPAWGDRVEAWPVGIDTENWRPRRVDRDIDVLVYNKILWRKEERDVAVVQPIREWLQKRGMRWKEIRYGNYTPLHYQEMLSRSRSMIFLCEHETQGIAYQQAMSAGVPVLAWDKGGCWEDPSYYPHLVKWGPVSSTPYFDDRCGRRFHKVDEFPSAFSGFFSLVEAGSLDPRAYILENLTLELQAKAYLSIAERVYARWSNRRDD